MSSDRSQVGARPFDRGAATDASPDGTDIVVGGADAAAAGRILADADRLFHDHVGTAPADFVAQLFAQAAPEDLSHYDAADLAGIATGTWRFLGERTRRHRHHSH